MRYSITGVVSSNSTVTVYNDDGVTPATIYAAQAGGVALAGGIVQADTLGIVKFWVEDSDYPMIYFFTVVGSGHTESGVWSFFTFTTPPAAAPAIPTVETITATEVANLILNILGLDEITDLVTDTTVKGKTLRRFWNRILKALLRSHPWKFATKRASVSLSGVTPAFGFAHAYVEPEDCMRVLAGEFTEDDMKVEGRYILSDEPTLEIRYVYFLEDPSYWDPCFLSCYASRMAAETALALTEDATKQKANLELYALKLREAKLSDGQEGKPREMTFTSLTEVR